jgi:hypothetical protein
LFILTSHHGGPFNGEAFSMHGMHSVRSAGVVGLGNGPSQPALPPAAYAEAVIELCGRIWRELEYLAQLCDRTAKRDTSKLLLTAATLRLELLVMLDSCESASWASMLIGEERENLCSMLSEVLEGIALWADELKRSHIEGVQDRLFDEVMGQYARVFACDDGRMIRQCSDRDRADANLLSRRN